MWGMPRSTAEKTQFSSSVLLRPRPCLLLRPRSTAEALFSSSVLLCPGLVFSFAREALPCACGLALSLIKVSKETNK